MDVQSDFTAPVETLIAYTADVLRAAGLPGDDAVEVARLMIEADLLGSEAHGIFRLPRYVDRLRAGGFNSRPAIRVERRKGAMALVDGDDAMGHLVVKRCVDEAMALASGHGVAWVGCRNGNHAGAAGVYAMMPVEQDMIGVYVAVGSANHMAPWGGLELLLSTNPIAIGVPGGADGPVLLDMATTNTAYGAVKVAAQNGLPIPEGWMIDAAGAPLTDPTKSEGGSLLPIGGAKGYGLALMFGLLAGTLNGAAFGRDVIDFNKDDVTPTNTGQFVIVADVKAFGDVAVFKARVDAIRAEMKSSPLRAGFDEIRLPGERSLGLRARRLAEGVVVAPALLKALRRLSETAGVVALEDRA